MVYFLLLYGFHSIYKTFVDRIAFIGAERCKYFGRNKSACHCGMSAASAQAEQRFCNKFSRIDIGSFGTYGELNALGTVIVYYSYIYLYQGQDKISHYSDHGIGTWERDMAYTQGTEHLDVTYSRTVGFKVTECESIGIKLHQYGVIRKSV